MFHIVTSTSETNVRSGPSIVFDAVSKLRYGIVIDVLETPVQFNDEYIWQHIRYLVLENGKSTWKSGYAATDFFESEPMQVLEPASTKSPCPETKEAPVWEPILTYLATDVVALWIEIKRQEIELLDEALKKYTQNGIPSSLISGSE